MVQLVDGCDWGVIPSLHDCESDVMINRAGRVTSFPGHSHVFCVQLTMKTWEWLGNEATNFWCHSRFVPTQKRSGGMYSLADAANYVKLVTQYSIAIWLQGHCGNITS